jgi:uroporphyrinogen decarboxylase
MLRKAPGTSLLLRALAGEANPSPPIWLMRQAGRYLPEYREIRTKVPSFLNLCLNPELAAEVTLQPLRRFDLDAAIVFSDILIVPHALGQKVEFVEGEGPRLAPIRDGKGVMALRPNGVGEALGPVYETVERVVGTLPQSIPLIGFCGAPWTVATYMVEGGGSKDQAEARAFAYREPAVFQTLIDALVEASSEYLLGQVRAGASVLQIFDSWAGSLPEDQFARWVIAPTKRLVEQVKAETPQVPVIGFPRGAGPLAERYARETGIDAISCDTSLPLDFIKERLQSLMPVQGNLDPVLLLAGGPALDRRTKTILTTLGRSPFVFNLGHGILPDTPIDHVVRLVSLVKAGSA